MNAWAVAEIGAALRFVEETPRSFLPERAQCFNHQRRCEHRIHDERDLGLQPACDRLRLGAEIGELAEDAMGARQHGPAGFAEDRTVAGAVEQGSTNLVLSHS